MPRLAVLLFLVAALLQLVSSASVSILSPKPNQKLELGETLEIKWEISKHAEHNFEYVSIALASGPAQALIIDEIIANKVAAKSGSYKWKIPKNLKPKDNYVIEIGPHADDIAFAGFVSINKPKAQSSHIDHNSTTSTAPKASPSVSDHKKHRKAHSSSPAPEPSAKETHKVKSAAPSSKAHSHKDVKTKVPPSAAPTPSPVKPVALICLAYPPESKGATSSTTCRPLSSYTQYNFESIAVVPKKHGSHKRKSAASSKHQSSAATATTHAAPHKAKSTTAAN